MLSQNYEEVNLTFNGITNQQNIAFKWSNSVSKSISNRKTKLENSEFLMSSMMLQEVQNRIIKSKRDWIHYHPLTWTISIPEIFMSKESVHFKTPTRIGLKPWQCGLDWWRTRVNNSYRIGHPARSWARLSVFLTKDLIWIEKSADTRLKIWFERRISYSFESGWIESKFILRNHDCNQYWSWRRCLASSRWVFKFMSRDARTWNPDELRQPWSGNTWPWSLS